MSCDRNECVLTAEELDAAYRMIDGLKDEVSDLRWDLSHTYQTIGAVAKWADDWLLENKDAVGAWLVGQMRDRLREELPRDKR